MTPEQLEHWAREHSVLFPKLLPDGRVAFVYQLMFTAAICVGRLEDKGCYDERWCYHTAIQAAAALALWDGTGEPAGWHRHPTSGRRRPDGDPVQEYVAP